MAETIIRGSIQVTLDTTDQVLIAAAAGTTYEILALYIVCTSASTTFTLKSDTTALSGTYAYGAGGELNLAPANVPHFVTAAGQGFKINGANTKVVSGHYVAIART